MLITGPVFYIPQTDTAQDKLELGNGKGDAFCLRRHRQFISPFLQPFIIKPVAVALEAEELDMGASLIDEDEHITAQRVLSELILYNPRQAVKALADVSGMAIQEVAAVVG